MSRELKMAIITPLLKKATLDPSILKNFRPISNLSYLSKLIERVVAARLKNHMTINGLKDPLQSAYSANHSCETAIAKVWSDIILSLDDNRCVLLVLLDLSSAFDTIDHQTLLSRLNVCFGISGLALSRFSSYLDGRQQQIAIKGSKSCQRPLKYGVPQGSVLGPLLFTYYLQPLGAIISAHGVSYHCYADDTQLYLSTNINEIDAAITTLQHCVADVQNWLKDNYLLLNASKTEVMILARPSILRQINIKQLLIGDTTVKLKTQVRNLGAIFDTSLNMSTQIDLTCRACYANIRNLSKARRFLNQRALKQLVTDKKAGLIGSDEFEEKYPKLQDELTELETTIYNMKLGTDVK